MYTPTTCCCVCCISKNIIYILAILVFITKTYPNSQGLGAPWFFRNKQDCGGNALSHSIALPLAIDHTHHHYISSYRCFIPLLVPSVVLLIAGVLRTSWVLLGWTGLVVSCTAKNPARLVYGSAALVPSLTRQKIHFATLPTNPEKTNEN